MMSGLPTRIESTVNDGIVCERALAGRDLWPCRCRAGNRTELTVRAVGDVAFILSAADFGKG